MPMNKNLESVHEKLRQISDESSKLAKQKYTASDIEKLQDELHEIDTKYSEGAFGNNDNGDRYEQQGQGQVADELERLHANLRGMLERSYPAVKFQWVYPGAMQSQIGILGSLGQNSVEKSDSLEIPCQFLESVPPHC